MTIICSDRGENYNFSNGQQINHKTWKEPIQKWQGCGKVVESLQPCHKLVATLPPPRHNHAIVSQAYCNLATTISICHKLVKTLSQHCNIFTTPLQPFDNLTSLWQVTHVHLMIFILTKTQRKYRSSLYLSMCPYIVSMFTGKSPYLIFQKKQCKLGVLKNSICIGGRSAWLARKHTKNTHFELYDEFDDLVTVS